MEVINVIKRVRANDLKGHSIKKNLLEIIVWKTDFKNWAIRIDQPTASNPKYLYEDWNSKTNIKMFNREKIK